MSEHQRKTRVGVIFGGKSNEHEISLISARNVVSALDREKFELILIKIDKEGRWVLCQENDEQIWAQNAVTDSQEFLALSFREKNGAFINLSSGEVITVDVVFPVLHGPYGEDGTIQGLLKMASIPCVGCDVLSSAVSMDKEVMKRLFQRSDIPTARFIVVSQNARDKLSYASVVEELGSPFFIKPANAGSSVGVSKVKSITDFSKALEEAFLHDKKILIEECIMAREIECAVLGNDVLAASLPGELIPSHEFYSYEAKYLDPKGAELIIPADLTPETSGAIRQMAIDAFRSLYCRGMARVDFFLTAEGKLFVNEVNTIPGFTKISMYPKMWEVSGLSYRELMERLISLALDQELGAKQIKALREAESSLCNTK